MAEEETRNQHPTGNIAADDVCDESGRKLECAICLQTCIHPVKLPCRHIFCFLCVKGIANQSKRCAMCRQEIPSDYLDKPNLLSSDDLDLNFAFEDGNQWFYEGRNGWWQYDERTSSELETAYKRGDVKCEVLVAGFLYIVDFQHMVQMRRNDPSRRRRIKRDFASISKKGVAGIRVDPTDENAEDDTENTWTTPGIADVPPACDDAADNTGYLSVTRVKIPSTTPATPSNTPQTPLSSTDASVPSSPGRATLLDSVVDQSLVNALHTLNIVDVNDSVHVAVHPWDVRYSDDI